MLRIAFLMFNFWIKWSNSYVLFSYFSLQNYFSRLKIQLKIFKINLTFFLEKNKIKIFNEIRQFLLI